MDLDRGAAYKQWAAGDQSDKPWADHLLALDLIYNAMDALLLHGTQWVYTAGNRNDGVIGDGWNQEDFSIYSQDQATSPDDPWSGGRALKGLVRPRPLVVQGEVLSLEFARIAATFQCVLRTPKTLASGAPEAVGTVLYIPRLQYPHGFEVAVAGDAGATVLQDELAQRLVVAASVPDVTLTIVVTPRRRPPPPRSFSTLVRSWMT